MSHHPRWARGFFVVACLYKHGPILIRSARVSFTSARKGTSERDVHGELSSPEPGQVLGETSIRFPSVAPTPLFLTLAPTSMQTLARRRSIGVAPFLSLPVRCLQRVQTLATAARRLVDLERQLKLFHQQCPEQMWRNHARTPVPWERKRALLQPEWERRCARQVAGRTNNMLPEERVRWKKPIPPAALPLAPLLCSAAVVFHGGALATTVSTRTLHCRIVCMPPEALPNTQFVVRHHDAPYLQLGAFGSLGRRLSAHDAQNADSAHLVAPESHPPIYWQGYQCPFRISAWRLLE